MSVCRIAAVTACVMLWAPTLVPMSTQLANTRHQQPHAQQVSRGEMFFDAKNIQMVDAEQAKATGGLIALYPRAVDAQTLAIPGGEPLEDLHLSLVDFGMDVRGFSDVELKQQLDALKAAPPHPIEAQVFGHAVLNPDSGASGAAVVYLVGDSTGLASLRRQVLQFSEQLFRLPTQHEPWLAHITASYGLSGSLLTYAGPVIFDRIGLSWAGDITYFAI